MEKKPKYKDTDRMPAERYNVDCLNCGQDWGIHAGWACDTSEGYKTKSQLAPTDRYLTTDMLPPKEVEWFDFKHFRGADE